MPKKKSSKTKKIKVLAIGDIHGDSSMAKKLAKKAKKENVDIVILAGDLTLFDQPIKNIIKPFVENKKDILIIPGNHESIATTDFLSQIYDKTKHLHGYSFKKNNVGFFGAGAADIGPFNIRDSKIFDLLKKSHKKIKNLDKKIMVTHMHPKGSKSEFSGIEGSEAIRKAILEFQPDIAICAHIHEAGGIEEKIGNTKVINVSRKAKIFEI